MQKLSKCASSLQNTCTWHWALHSLFSRSFHSRTSSSSKPHTTGLETITSTFPGTQQAHSKDHSSVLLYILFLSLSLSSAIPLVSLPMQGLVFHPLFLKVSVFEVYLHKSSHPLVSSFTQFQVSFHILLCTPWALSSPTISPFLVCDFSVIASYLFTYLCVFSPL